MLLFLSDRRSGGAAVPHDELLRFLARVQAAPALRLPVMDAVTADEMSRLAQDLGYWVSGSDLLRFQGQSASGVRITRGTTRVNTPVATSEPMARPCRSLAGAQGRRAADRLAPNGPLATTAAMLSCCRHDASGRFQPFSQRWASSGVLICPSSRP